MQTVARYTQNRCGQDYVVGDIHGEYPRLSDVLTAIGFDPSRDRLFSTGDLIDRGSQSALAFEWIAKPWFHPVLGNHEAVLIDPLISAQELLLWQMFNGGDWWARQREEDRDSFLAALRALPIACEVSTTIGQVGIVHADVPEGLSWDQFIAALEQGDSAVRHCALWSRTRLLQPNIPPVAGIDRIYCGHTPVATPTLIGNVRFIDTGACFGGTLTVERIDSNLRF